MKKLIRKITGITLIAALFLSIAGCGGSSGQKTETPETTEAAEATETTEAPEVAEDTETTEVSTLDDFITNMQPQIDEMSDSMKESGLEMAVEARDNSLVYKYTYINDVGEIDVMKEALDASMEAMAPTFEGVLSSLKESVPDAEAVVVEYYSESGELITSQEYK